VSNPSSTAAGALRPTLIDSVTHRTLALDLGLVAAGAGLTALAAQIVVPLWPIPMTMQTFAVLLVGTTLGPLRGVLSMALYLMLGIVGVPVFAEGLSGNVFALSSGGFLIGFVLAVALVGRLAERAWDRRFVGTLVSFVAGTLVMYAVGLPWLYASLSNLGPAVWQDYLGFDSVLAATIGTGVLPFLVGDILKALLAAAVIPLAWRGVRRLEASRKPQQ